MTKILASIKNVHEAEIISKFNFDIVDIKNGKKTVKEKSLLPGYILVKMAMSNEIKFFIETSSSNGSDKITEREPANPKIINIFKRCNLELAPKKIIKLFINLYFRIFLKNFNSWLI